MAEDNPLVKQIQTEFQTKLQFDENWTAKVAELVEKSIRDELNKPGASTKATVGNVCHGTMRGIVLSEKDAGEGVVQVLKAIGVIAQERSGDPMQTMTYALEGISRIAKVCPPQTLTNIQGSIESHFMGAGGLFIDLCAKVTRGS